MLGVFDYSHAFSEYVRLVRHLNFKVLGQIMHFRSLK